jgi:hypothetical protein
MKGFIDKWESFWNGIQEFPKPMGGGSEDPLMA